MEYEKIINQNVRRTSNTIRVTVGDIAAIVNTNGRVVNPYELEENINGLFQVQKKFNANEKVDLSNFCDTFINLKFVKSIMLDNRVENHFVLA